jgi:ribosomal protein S18 acetylase RimI-like enzyme
VTVERPDGLIGVASFQAAEFPQGPLAQIKGYPYISVIGVSDRYRGRRKDGQRPGDMVLFDMLATIAARGQWGPTPDVFALVDPHNGPSCALFERHDFQVLASPREDDTESDCLYWRPEQKP